MVILLHSSKTMHTLDDSYSSQQMPGLQTEAERLATFMQSLSKQSIEKAMDVSKPLALTIQATYKAWSTEASKQRSAIHSFAGDIYSGLQIHTWDDAMLAYAEQHLRIISGLYGILRPLDGIMPYRLELGYKLPKASYSNLYTYWGDAPAKQLLGYNVIVDLTAKEYSKLVLPYLKDKHIITPKFLTISPKTGAPTFIVVHAKIARGAFAAWLIRNQVTDIAAITEFDDLGYAYNAKQSSPCEPDFICNDFKGLGLSVRMQHKN